MEKNCLVTKYKATVNDNSLLKIGEMALKAIASTKSEYTVNFTTYPQVIETLDGSLSLTTDPNLLTGFTNKIILNSSYATFYKKNQDVVIVIPNKYDIKDLMCSNTVINLDDLKYSNSLNMLAGFLCKGSLANIKDKPITNLNGLNFEENQDIINFSGLTSLINIVLYSNPIYGDISALSGLTSLTKLWMPNSSVSGNISSLSGLTALKSISFDETYLSGDIESIGTLINLTELNICSPNGEGVRGEIINFVNSQRSHGRTIGNIKIRANSNITFNGSYLTNTNYYNISWTASTITNETTSETVDR